MDRIARASTDERRLVFEAAAQRMALAPAVVEKDFWVCYTLDHLFHRSGFAESMVFKGGTSLSKAFGLIERFSEDIDLILDWRLLGYGENEPWEPVYCQPHVDKIGVMISTLSAFCVPTAFPTSEICQA